MRYFPACLRARHLSQRRRWIERTANGRAIAESSLAEMQASGDTVGTDAVAQIIEAIEACEHGPSGTVS